MFIKNVNLHLTGNYKFSNLLSGLYMINLALNLLDEWAMKSQAVRIVSQKHPIRMKYM